MKLAPVTLAEAKRFIALNHRHNAPPVGHRFAVGVTDSESLVGVGVAGNPTARGLADGFTLEVTRTCTNGTPNANSMIYGALRRAAKALGWRRLVTYTLEGESGASLKASGWTVEEEGIEPRAWDTPSRPRAEIDLFGSRRPPQLPRTRWVVLL